LFICLVVLFLLFVPAFVLTCSADLVLEMHTLAYECLLALLRCAGRSDVEQGSLDQAGEGIEIGMDVEGEREEMAEEEEEMEGGGGKRSGKQPPGSGVNADAMKVAKALTASEAIARCVSIALKSLLPNLLITFVQSKGATTVSKPAKQVRGTRVGLVRCVRCVC
jgi:hypothetical protein